MYGATLFDVHNSKIFPSGHFLIGANASGVSLLHPVTKEEIHSPFFFSDLLRWEFTPKVSMWMPMLMHANSYANGHADC